MGSSSTITCSSTMSTASVINGEVKPSSTSSSNSSPNLGGHSSHKEKTKKLTFVDQVKAGDSRTNGTDDQQKRAPQKNNIPGILYLDSNAKKETKLDGNGCKLINGYGKKSVATAAPVAAVNCALKRRKRKITKFWNQKKNCNICLTPSGFKLPTPNFLKK